MPTAATALLDLVLRPLLERYSEEPQILAWDIINEPEWIKTIDAAGAPRVSRRQRRADPLEHAVIR